VQQQRTAPAAGAASSAAKQNIALHLTHCRIAGPLAGGKEGSGAGVFIFSGCVELRHCTVSHGVNGIVCKNADLYVRFSRITQCRFNGISSSSRDVRVSDSCIGPVGRLAVTVAPTNECFYNGNCDIQSSE